jgi:hypothetical protein
MIVKGKNWLPDQFSYLALLEVIAAGGVEAFWTESENLCCDTGNPSLADALAGSHLGWPYQATKADGRDRAKGPDRPAIALDTYSQFAAITGFSALR